MQPFVKKVRKKGGERSVVCLLVRSFHLIMLLPKGQKIKSLFSLSSVKAKPIATFFLNRRRKRGGGFCQWGSFTNSVNVLMSCLLCCEAFFARSSGYLKPRFLLDHQGVMPGIYFFTTSQCLALLLTCPADCTSRTYVRFIYKNVRAPKPTLLPHPSFLWLFSKLGF